jgi:hypothetical protein
VCDSTAEFKYALMCECVVLPLWRNQTVCGKLGDGKLSSAIEDIHIFPSGRQSIAHVLKVLGIVRSDRVAFPEWSSQCVLNAIGSAASPLPMREAVRHGIPVRAVLVYEQWGWPLISQSIEEIGFRFPGCNLIVDRVDSPQMAILPAIRGMSHVAEIWSLSKTLGLPGGGMARIDGQWLEFKPAANNLHISEALFPMIDDPFVQHILKTEVPAVPPETLIFTRKFAIAETMEAERLARLDNLRAIMDSNQLQKYPEWMSSSGNSGAGPGIVPLYIGSSQVFLESRRSFYEKKYGIETRAYHFNISGDAVWPLYENCLAFPIHGMLDPKLIAAAVGDC